jgi:hypothetical protein
MTVLARKLKAVAVGFAGCFADVGVYAEARRAPDQP